MFRGGPQLRTKIRMIEVKVIISHKTEWQTSERYCAVR